MKKASQTWHLRMADLYPKPRTGSRHLNSELKHGPQRLWSEGNPRPCPHPQGQGQDCTGVQSHSLNSVPFTPSTWHFP
jgi:hypothetical protein